MGIAIFPCRGRFEILHLYIDHYTSHESMNFAMNFENKNCHTGRIPTKSRLHRLSHTLGAGLLQATSIQGLEMLEEKHDTWCHFVVR